MYVYVYMYIYTDIVVSYLHMKAYIWHLMGIFVAGKYMFTV